MEPSNVGREFRDFLFKTNMFALALAVVVGQAVNQVVQAIVTDLIMPFAGVVKKEGDWWEPFSIWRFHFPVGHLFGTLLNFMVIAGVVFLLTKVFLRQESAAVPSKACPRCKETIHAEATRCKFCTSDL